MKAVGTTEPKCATRCARRRHAAHADAARACVRRAAPCSSRSSQTDRVAGTESTALGRSGFSGGVNVKAPLAQTSLPSAAVHEPSASG
eukprot:2818419-Prymnesium_polylepis.3